jgi:hypothetical protein
VIEENSVYVNPIKRLVLTYMDDVHIRSKAWIVFARSNAGIEASNPTQGMGVCVRLFCV